MCQWMVSRGAKKLVITSRSGVKTGYQQWKLDILKSKGVDLKVSNLDVSDYDQALQLLQEANKMGPVGGVFHLAVVSEEYSLTITSVKRASSLHQLFILHF